MSDLIERAFDDFAEATEQTVLRLSAEVQKLRDELAGFREQRRAASDVEPQPAPEPGPPGDKGEPGDPGPEGRGVAAAELRGGDLIFRFTDGAEVNVGRVTGEQGLQGEPGERGVDGVPGERGERGEAGERGERGTDGRDGAATREEIEAIIEARMAEVTVRTFADIYRGVYRAGEQYARGETATWGGHLFVCLADTTDKPMQSGDWQMIAKAGRDGRDRA